MSPQTQIRLGIALAVSSAGLALLTPVMLLITAFGLLLWSRGRRHRDEQHAAQARALRAELLIDATAAAPGGDANDQLLCLARDAGIADDGQG